MKCQILFSYETMCMKSQILIFSRNNKKNITNLSSAESANSVVLVLKVKFYQCLNSLPFCQHTLYTLLGIQMDLFKF